jgi:hypothetical protein
MALSAGPLDPFKMSGTGSIDLAHHLVGLSARIENAPPRSAAARPIQTIIDYSNGFVEYLRSDLFAGHLPAGNSWVKLDVGRYAKKEGVDIGRVMRSHEAGPTKVLDMLRRSGSRVLVGQETLGSETMAHYRSAVDVRRLIAAEPDAATRASLQRAMEGSGTTSFPVDVEGEQP